MREPQQDRSRVTRQRLLEATIDCLAENGWAATTVGVVATRAGVSRGATQHHFPTREDLITAALEYYTGNLFKAALQVWTAAASDPALRERVLPLEDRFGRTAHRMAIDQLGV